MVPGLGLFRKRNKGPKGGSAEAFAVSQDGVLQVSEPGRKSLSKAPAGINDSVHSLHNMDHPSPSNIAKKSPPPSPTSILPEVNFLDLSGSDGKASEPSSASPDEEHTITPDDAEWAWHELPSEVDPKDAATPDRSASGVLQTAGDLAEVMQRSVSRFLLLFHSHQALAYPTCSVLKGGIWEQETCTNIFHLVYRFCSLVSSKQTAFQQLPGVAGG